MSKRYWPVPVSECVIALCIVAFLWHGGRIVDAVAGLPGPDQQLIVACYFPSSGCSFDEALAQGASVSAHNDDGATALMLSASLGRVEYVQRLLQKEADVNAADRWGRTPLMYAAISDRRDTMQLLLACGANAEQKDFFGMTAADWLQKYYNE